MASPHIPTHIGRGFRYALTSTASLFAGYLIQQHRANRYDYVVLILLSFIGIYFFLCYSERFPASDEQVAGERERAIREETIYILPFGIGGVAAFVVVILVGLAHYKFAMPIASVLILNAALFFAYGIYLRRMSQAKAQTIRHRLVWPILLSIGMNLYLGLTFAELFSSWLPIYPLLVLLFAYCITSFFGRRFFLGFSLSGFALLTVFTLLIRRGVLSFLSIEMADYFSTLQFCIIVSAYLAVFESWVLPSEIAQAEGLVPNAIGEPNTQIAKSKLYFLSTIVALMLSLWTLPFFFTLSKYGSVFLAAFGLHSFVSFLYWARLGDKQPQSSTKWRARKTWFGVSFLAILAFASFPRLSGEPTTHTLPDFVTWTGFGLLFALGSFPTVQLYRSISGFYDWRVRSALLETVNIVRLLGLLSLLACALILLIFQSWGHESVIWYKSERAFLFYSCCIVFAFAAEVYHDFGKRRRGSALPTILALLTLIRLVPSLLIGLTVMAPALYKGYSLATSVALALPFFFSAIGGYALNDYFDQNRDLINKPYRAIPSGLISARTVLILAAVSLFGALASAIYAASDTWELLIFFGCIFGVATYNIFVRFLSLSKTVLTAAVSSLPLLYAFLRFDYPLRFSLLPIAAALFVLGREWLMDVRDVRGDKFSGIRTLPMIMGEERTARIAFCVLGAACALLLVFFADSPSVWSGILAAATVGSTFAMLPLWFRGSDHLRQQVIRVLWFPMLMGILQFLS